MFDMQKMMKQAQKMQERLNTLNDELAETKVTGTAGGGAVTVVCNGKSEVLSVKISPDAAGDAGMLEDLILAAIQDAQKRVADMTQEKMSAITGGMKLPGMPF